MIGTMTDDELAAEVAAAFSYLGPVRCAVDFDGRIGVRGERLPPHPDLRDHFPRGWSLVTTYGIREARRRLPAWRARNRIMLAFSHRPRVEHHGGNRWSVSLPREGTVGVGESQDAAWLEAERHLLDLGLLGDRSRRPDTSP